MSEEIIIKTETVKVEDLQGREKQIYDYAFERGIEVGIRRPVSMFFIIGQLSIAVTCICFVIFIISTCSRNGL